MKNKYSIGTDASEINRFNPNDVLFVKKNLHKGEIIYFNSLETFEKKQKFLAKIWTLKEAMYKSNNSINIYEIEIGNLKNGSPVCLNFKGFSLSLSYCGLIVIAVSLFVE